MKKSSLFLFYFVFCNFYVFANLPSKQAGKLVFLVGTSSSGKTTLGKMSAQANNQVVFFEHDKIWAKKEINFLSQQLGERFNHFFALYGTSLIEMSFRNKKCVHVSQRIQEYQNQEELLHLLQEIKEMLGPIRKHFYQETTKDIFEKTEQLIQEGKTVILDKIIDEEDLDLFGNFNPYFFVVYYPFKDLYQRLLLRNQQAIAEKDSYNYRHYLEAYLQYAHLFTTSTVNSDIAIDILNKNQIKETLNTAYQLDPYYLNLDDFYILSDDFNINKYFQDLIESMKISEAVENKIISRFGADLIIYTNELNPQEAYEQIENFWSQQKVGSENHL